MNIREPLQFKPVKHRRRRKRLYRRLSRVTAGLLVVGLLLSLLVRLRYYQALPLLTAQVVPPRYYNGAVSLAWPGQAAAAVGVLGYGMQTTHGSQTARPIASLAKLMLALAVLKTHPLRPNQPGPAIELSAADEALYHQYVDKGVWGLPVQTGQQINQHQALQAVLLSPANNLADSLAIWAFGSLDKYFTAANNLAINYGMINSRFAGDASGLSPLTVSTPTDIVLLGQAVLKQPLLHHILTQSSAEIDGVGTIYNSLDDFNHEQAGQLALKAGLSDKAGGCLLLTAEHQLNGQSLTIIVVVMGAIDLEAALSGARPLLISAKQAFGFVTVIRRRQILANYQLPWGGQVAVVAAEPVEVVSWKATKPKLEITVDKLQPPQTAGAVVGRVVVKSAVSKASVRLVLDHELLSPPPAWRWRRAIAI